MEVPPIHLQEWAGLVADVESKTVNREVLFGLKRRTDPGYFEVVPSEGTGLRQNLDSPFSELV